MPYIVSIEGNIGAGKSTILKHIAEEGYKVFPEPFEKNPFLPLFYAEPSRYAYHVQMHFLSARRNQFLAAQHSTLDPYETIFVERTIYTDRYVFAYMLHQQGTLSDLDWRGYLYHFETVKNNKPDLAIILSVKPEDCLERIRERGREMEQTIPVEYLQNFAQIQDINMNFLGNTVRNNYFPHTPEENAKNIIGIVESIKERSGFMIA